LGHPFVCFLLSFLLVSAPVAHGQGVDDGWLDLRDGWRIRLDPENVGTDEGWWDPALEDDAWREIRVDRFYEDQGIDYDGYSWYRLRFPVPEVWDGVSFIGPVDIFERVEVRFVLQKM